MRTRTGIRVAFAVIVGVGIGGACDAGGEMMADAMVDAGERLMDAGEVVRDASSDDAAAQLDAEAPAPGPTLRVFDVPCEETRTIFTVRGPGSLVWNGTERRTDFHAEVRGDDLTLESIASVSAFACGFGSDEEGADGLTPLDCHSIDAHFEEGVLRVHCGAEGASDEDCFDGEGCTGWVEGEPLAIESVRISVLSR